MSRQLSKNIFSLLATGILAVGSVLAVASQASAQISVGKTGPENAIPIDVGAADLSSMINNFFHSPVIIIILLFLF